MPLIYEPLGANVSETTTAAKFRLGERASGEQGQEYLYVLSSGTITQYAAVAVDEDFTARALTTTLAGQANTFGTAQVAFTTDKYGWVAVNGCGLNVLCRDNIAANAQLFTTASAGKLTSTASTGGALMVQGVRSATAAASGGGATEIVMSYPSFNPRYGAAA
jgi:hypothetical protein